MKTKLLLQEVKYGVFEVLCYTFLLCFCFLYPQLSLESTLMNTTVPMCLLVGKNGLDYLKTLGFTTTRSVEME